MGEVATLRPSAVFPIPEAALANHIAILGKTGSGKTSTEKLTVEHVVAEGFRVCVLDPIKSDWWGITSSADGSAPGLPFRILGGPHGHVPLPSSAGKVIGQLVGSGKLPLSIIDMADFEPGGLQRFFNDFAPALLRSARGVLYLVIEEAHEFAPKERSGIGKETIAIHWAKKLATAGRSKGIRLIVATQRTQALHNAVLGSCETLVAHRLTTPADQDSVVKWLKTNTDKATAAEIESGLASLPTGTGWLCSGEAGAFERVGFPKFATYDNTATPTADSDEITVKTAPVDHDELRSLIGDAVRDAEANDPKALKVEVARLTRELAAASKGGAPAWPDQRGKVAALVAELSEHSAALERLTANAKELQRRQEAALAALTGESIAIPVVTAPQRRPSPAPAPVQRQSAPAREPRPSEGNGALTGPQRRVLNALAWWAGFGLTSPSKEQVAFIAGYSPSSGGFNNLCSGLRSGGLVDYPSGGKIALTVAGEAVAEMSAVELTQQAFHAQVRAKLSNPQVKVLDPILAAYPHGLTKAEVADAAGYSASSGGFNNLCSSMKSLTLLEYPQPGYVRAAVWLFP